MLERILNEPVVDVMQRGLHAASLRQAVISNNIANVNTPNFKKSDVVFEQLLAKELGYTDVPEGVLRVVRTHDRHFPLPMVPERAEARVERQDVPTMRVDNNNVDVDVEMAEMSKNQLYYNVLVRQLGGHMSRLKSIISSNAGGS